MGFSIKTERSPGSDSHQFSASLRFEYAPFGQVGSQTGSFADQNNILFSTKYWDKETGLGYWGYRWSNGERWLSRDPIGERGGRNLYGFVRNRLLNAIDYLGQAEVPAPADPVLDGIKNLIQAIKSAIAAGERLDSMIDQLLQLVDQAITNIIAPVQDIEELRKELEKIRDSGHARYPRAGEDDCMRHCVVSCEITQKYGSKIARVAGVINELQGAILYDIPDLWGRISGKRRWGFQWEDLVNNADGRACATSAIQPCEQCCLCVCFPLKVVPAKVVYPGNGGGNSPPSFIEIPRMPFYREGDLRSSQ